jgi:hypothetical protein
MAGSDRDRNKPLKLTQTGMKSETATGRRREGERASRGGGRTWRSGKIAKARLSQTEIRKPPPLPVSPRQGYPPPPTPRLLLQWQSAGGRGGNCAIIGADGSHEPPVDRRSVRGLDSGRRAGRACKAELLHCVGYSETKRSVNKSEGVWKGDRLDYLDGLKRNGERGERWRQREKKRFVMYR